MSFKKRFSLSFTGSKGSNVSSSGGSEADDDAVAPAAPPPRLDKKARRFSLTFGRSHAPAQQQQQSLDDSDLESEGIGHGGRYRDRESGSEGERDRDSENESQDRISDSVQTHRPTFAAGNDKDKEKVKGAALSIPKASRRSSLTFSLRGPSSAPSPAVPAMEEKRRVARLSFAHQVKKNQSNANESLLRENSSSGLWSLDHKKMKSILLGKFEGWDSLELPKPSLHIFVSSGGKDSDAERIILMDKIYPVLKEKGAREGIDVLFIDLVGTDSSSAVRDNPVDGDIWLRSVEEIQRCYEQSGGMFFLSLQGHKAGFVPLPKFLDKTLFEERLASEEIAQKGNCGELVAVAKEWYRLDENHVPQRYILTTPTRANKKKYLLEVHTMLTEVFREVNREEYFVLGRTIGEWESILAANLDSSGCRWISREYEVQHTEKDVGGSDECKDSSVGPVDDPSVVGPAVEAVAVDELVADVRHKLKTEYLPAENIHKATFSIPKSHSTRPIAYDSDEYKAYLQCWEDMAFLILESELKGVMELRNAWTNDGGGCSVIGRDLDEMVHHVSICVEESKGCQGRTAEIGEMLNTMAIANKPQDAQQVPFGSISCCVVGDKGVGKTTLLSKIASLFNNAPGDSKHAVPPVFLL